MRGLVVSLLVAGCSGSELSEPWLLEWNDCVLHNDILRNSQATSWRYCRVYWNGESEPDNGEPFARIALIGNSSGSFDAPGQDWLIVNVGVSDVPGDLLRSGGAPDGPGLCGARIILAKKEIGERTLDCEVSVIGGYCGASGRPGEAVGGSFSMSGSTSASAGGFDTNTGPLP